jgi:2-polyprenyl-6-hydroxyphenyl methylase/3-demethylubiquinone-9 3-methyltransferase
MNVDDSNYTPAEVEKFELIANDWWDPTGKLKTLHKINPLRLQYILDAASLKNARVLDIGCGGGLLTEAMAASGAIVTGIDAGEVNIRFAKAHLQQSGLAVEYVAGTVEQFSLSANRQFDVITCMEMLEHVPDPAAIIETASRLLRPGGHLFLSTLNRNLRSYLESIMAAEYLLQLIPKGTHTYAQYIRPSELGRWIRGAGMEIIDITGLKYLPLLERVYLSSDASVNYIVHAIKPD